MGDLQYEVEVFSSDTKPTQTRQATLSEDGRTLTLNAHENDDIHVIGSVDDAGEISLDIILRDSQNTSPIKMTGVKLQRVTDAQAIQAYASDEPCTDWYIGPFPGHLPTTVDGQSNVFRDALYSTCFGGSKPRTFSSWSDLMEHFARPAIAPRGEFETNAEYEQRVKQLNWRKEFTIYLRPTLLPYSHDHGGFPIDLSFAALETSRNAFLHVGEKFGPEDQTWYNVSANAGDIFKSALCQDSVGIEVYFIGYELKWNCTNAPLLLRTGTAEKAQQLRANAASVELRLHCVYRGMSEKSVSEMKIFHSGAGLVILQATVRFREHTTDVTRVVAQLASEDFAVVPLTASPSFAFFYQRDTDLMQVKRGLVNGQPKVEISGKVYEASQLLFPQVRKALRVADGSVQVLAIGEGAERGKPIYVGPNSRPSQIQLSDKLTLSVSIGPKTQSVETGNLYHYLDRTYDLVSSHDNETRTFRPTFRDHRLDVGPFCIVVAQRELKTGIGVWVFVYSRDDHGVAQGVPSLVPDPATVFEALSADKKQQVTRND